jgi:hypothetical protein
LYFLAPLLSLDLDKTVWRYSTQNGTKCKSFQTKTWSAIEIISYTQRAWMKWYRDMTLLQNRFTRFFFTLQKIIFLVQLKHAGFLPLADVKPMSNDLVVHDSECLLSLWVFYDLYAYIFRSKIQLEISNVSNLKLSVGAIPFCKILPLKHAYIGQHLLDTYATR